MDMFDDWEDASPNSADGGGGDTFGSNGGGGNSGNSGNNGSASSYFGGGTAGANAGREAKTGSGYSSSSSWRAPAEAKEGSRRYQSSSFGGGGGGGGAGCGDGGIGRAAQGGEWAGGRENSAPPPRRQRSFGPRDVIIGGEDADVRVRRSLRCLKCDFDVARFANARWSADATYVFFRNYAGTPSELRRELVPARGVAAYCCQCAWQSVGREPKLMERFGTPAAPEGGSGNMDSVFWVRKS